MTFELLASRPRGPAHRAVLSGEEEAPDEPLTRAEVRATEKLGAGDVIITALGVVGILTVCWLVAAWMFSLSIIVFITGSMSPGLPAGSAAVVQQVSASALEVGDIVTVPKPGSAEPVTHRIVAIDAVAGSPDARALTLQGDANPAPDLGQYLVTEVRRLVVGAPGAGWLIIWSKNPLLVLAGSALLAAVITWAVWPRSPGRAKKRDRPPKREANPT